MKTLVRSLRELLWGLLGFPERRPLAGRDYAAVLEERWGKPRRCC